MIADYDISKEETLRRMSWYDFNFHMLALKRRNDALESDY
jgi:hypothetical protein